MIKASLFSAVLLVAAQARAAVHLVVYHTNDIHGWIMPRPDPFGSKRSIGGAAAFKALVDGDRSPNKLVLDAGDWFQGTPEGSVTEGQALVDVFNALGYDAIIVGNHEYDFGQPRLKQLIAQLKMPVLGANVYDAQSGKRVDYLKPWMIKDVGGVKVGLFGLLTTNMRNLTFPENIAGLRFRREIDEAKDAVAALRAQGAQVVIAMTHIGYQSPTMAPFEDDKALAAAVPGIDVIVGGHSHTFLREPRREGPNGTLIAQAGWSLTDAGKIDLDVDTTTNKVVSASGRLIDLWVDQFGQDPKVKAVADKESAGVSKVYDVVIATAEAPLTRQRDAESSLGDWMTDCEREWAGSDVAIQNAGGIRADIAPGPVTMRDIFNVMPFDNRVVKLTMNGRLLGEVFDHGVDKTKGLIQVSGASFGYDRDADDGKRIRDARVGGKPLDPSTDYGVATIDFLVKGGDGYTPFDRAERKEFTRELLRDVLRDCALKHPLIAAPANGRMTPLVPAAGGSHGP